MFMPFHFLSNSKGLEDFDVFFVFIDTEVVFPAQMLPAGPQVWILWPQESTKIMQPTQLVQSAVKTRGSCELVL